MLSNCEEINKKRNPIIIFFSIIWFLWYFFKRYLWMLTYTVWNLILITCVASLTFLCYSLTSYFFVSFFKCHISCLSNTLLVKDFCYFWYIYFFSNDINKYSFKYLSYIFIQIHKLLKCTSQNKTQANPIKLNIALLKHIKKFLVW